MSYFTFEFYLVCDMTLNIINFFCFVEYFSHKYFLDNDNNKIIKIQFIQVKEKIIDILSFEYLPNGGILNKIRCNDDV